MKTLLIILINAAFLKVSDKSVLSILQGIVILFVDIVYTHYIASCIRKKKYMEILHDIPKAVSLLFNCYVVVLVCVFLHTQYFSAEAMVVSKQYDELLVLNDFDPYASVKDVLPMYMKKTRISVDSMFNIKVKVLLGIYSGNLSQDDLDALVKEYTEHEHKLLEYEAWYSNFRLALVIVLSVAMFVEFLWYYTDIKFIIHKLRYRYIMNRITSLTG